MISLGVAVSQGSLLGGFSREDRRVRESSRDSRAQQADTRRTGLSTILPLLASFFLGSIPSGYIIGRLHGVDIRAHGSGNIGATNASRVLGKKAGVLTLVFDIAKGALAAAVGCAAARSASQNAAMLPAICGLAAVLGHCYSPFLNFKGGKGVAAALGAFLVATPLATLIAIGAFALTFVASKIVSLSSIIAALVLPAAALLAEPALPGAAVAAVAVGSAVVIGRHRTNIARLRNGTEPRFGAKKELTEPQTSAV